MFSKLFFLVALITINVSAQTTNSSEGNIFNDIPTLIPSGANSFFRDDSGSDIETRTPASMSGSGPMPLTPDNSDENTSTSVASCGIALSMGFAIMML